MEMPLPPGVFALPPKEPIKPHLLLNITLGLALGLMLSAFGALAVDWRRNNREDEQENKKDARSISGNERVRVLLKLLRGRQLPVELPGAQIEPKKTTRLIAPGSAKRLAGSYRSTLSEPLGDFGRAEAWLTTLWDANNFDGLS